jgi:DNA invertase Pin-like site-specific DNA recombinase
LRRHAESERRGLAGGAGCAPIPAAQYLRKSTDLQRYSTDNQSDANHDYAALYGMRIVCTYADEGKSGLTARRRPALKQLIADIEAGRADFAAVLVYDVSRWGRFQDADESSYYEHICKRAGIAVHYCAEPFNNDGSIYAAIVKSIKRAMAAEYSRELSVKVYAGQANIARRGFRVAGGTPYGTRRLIVDRTGTPKHVLSPGESKNLHDDRIVLIPGPPEETEVVRRIFTMFVKDGKSEGIIARELNADGVSSGLPRPWTPARIKWLLCNETYLGAIVWNRTSGKLATRRRRNHPDEWIRRTTSFAPFVERSMFQRAHDIFRTRRAPFLKEEALESLRQLARQHGFLDQRLIEKTFGTALVRRLHDVFGGVKKIRELIGAKPPPGPPWHLSNDEMLARLRRLLRRRGRLTKMIIEKSAVMPSSGAYEKRFGSLRRAYQLIGYTYRRDSALTDERALEALSKLRRKHGRVSTALIACSKATPSVATYRKRFGKLSRAYSLISYRWTYPKRRKRRSH